MIKEDKIVLVEEVKKMINEYSVIAIIDMHKMPSKQLQQIRKSLRGKAVIKMTKKSVLEYALDGVEDENKKQIKTHMPKQPTILVTDTKPFKIYSLVKNLKFKTFAKDGDIAKEDIWVFAGPTNLLAGPVISEFQQAGVSAGIQAGKIAIKKDKLLVKCGEPIDDKQANILRKLNIEPIEVTLNIVAIYDDGVVYTKDALGMTLIFPDMFPKAFNNALNLSVSICYPTKENIKYLLSKASMQAKALNGLSELTETVPETEAKSEDKSEESVEESPSEEKTKEPVKENEEGADGNKNDGGDKEV